MLRQLYALIALKAALFRHMWTLKRGLSYLISLVFIVMGLGAAIAAGVWLHWLGSEVLAQREPWQVLLLLDSLLLAFLFFWFFGLIMELQRADTIDLKKMLFLPASLRMVYGLNFIASLVTPGLIFFLAGATGLLRGMAEVHGASMAWAAMAFAAFYLMLAAWAYYLRGVLAMLMENQRRRRLILILMPLALVGLMQLPQLIPLLVLPNGPPGETAPGEDTVAWLYAANYALPLAWPALAVIEAAAGRVGRVAALSGGMLLVALAGLALGYRATLRHFLGGSGGGPAAPTQTAGMTVFTARGVPGLADDTAALVTQCLLSFYRHPRIRMIMVMTVLLGGMLFVLHGTRQDYAATPVGRVALPALVLVWPFFNFAMVFFNVFGVDLQGFRALMLLPGRRDRYLFAKNVALAPFLFTLSLLFTVAAALFTNAPWLLLALALVHAPVLFLGFALVGNFLSLYFPYRIVGRNTRGKGANRPMLLLISLGAMAVVAVLMVPASACLLLASTAMEQGNPPGLAMAFALSLLLLLVTAATYTVSLRVAGSLLAQREQHILGQLVRDAD
jgi:hypothetical protein